MTSYTVYLNSLEKSIRVHLKHCSVIENADAHTQGWRKDFDSLDAAILEMESAAGFCQIADFGPCKRCDPY